MTLESTQTASGTKVDLSTVTAAGGGAHTEPRVQRERRDTRKDKCSPILFVLRNFAGVWRVLLRPKLLKYFAEWIVVNFAIGDHTRPHPWSTVSAYTSWRSLTDRTYFARHLQARDVQDIAALPPTANVLNLFRRTGKARECPKSTMLFPAFAQYVTDSFLRTDVNQRNKTTSTHELDLSALYGRNTAQTNALRLGQHGWLKFQRLKDGDYPLFFFQHDGVTPKPEFIDLDLPLGHKPTLPEVAQRKIFAVGGDRANATPQIAMINTLFLREHNRIASELERQNPGWDDERLFQTARNILIPIYIKIVIEEYINHISSIAFPVDLEPKLARRAKWNRPNWMAVEFNLVYRWHSLVPDAISWNGRDVSSNLMNLDNRFLFENGANIANGLEWSSQQPACALGLFNTPAFLLPVEEKTIDLGRFNRVKSYNDYRVAMGMNPVDSFQQISGEPQVVAGLSDVYKTVDRLEFYTGLVAEEHVPNSPMPRLLGIMLGIDAFSQGLTNPLLSEHVYNENTFTEWGFALIKQKHTLRNLAERNIKGGLGGRLVTMTRPGWRRRFTMFAG